MAAIRRLCRDRRPGGAGDGGRASGGGKRGPFAQALLFAAAEVLPLLLLRGAGEDRRDARPPIAFRSALLRVAVFISLVVVVSLRFPGDFDPSLLSFRGDTVFAALGQWEGFSRLAAGTALGLSTVSARIVVLGDPAWTEVFPPWSGNPGVGRLLFLCPGRRARLSVCRLHTGLFGLSREGKRRIRRLVTGRLGSCLRQYLPARLVVRG